MGKALAFLMLLASLTALVGCKSDSAKSSSAEPQAATATQLGTWVSGCIASPQAGASGQPAPPPVYAKSSITIAPQQISATTAMYSDAACQTATSLWSAYTAAYALGNGTTSVPNAQTLDVTPTTLTMTPMDLSTVTGLNQSSYCGIKSWTIRVTQSVTGCLDSTGKPVLSPDYTIIAFNGNTMMVGLTSTTGAASSPATRPTALDTSTVYTRQ